ncbi:putative transporter C11D3.06 [Grifola frondosa]|uniref:Putative transporter C11D3.06 n=1 Tax=Grifola frondosa TaxID=5627 RepID=A0A1C7MM05_GRIFR|nr:putative transporter C11D3.06 [Grifola frondosa]
MASVRCAASRASGSWLTWACWRRSGCLRMVVLELVGLAASQLGPVSLATQSVLLVSASTTYQAPFALSVAASVRIGNLLGEERPKRAGIAAKCSILMSLVIGLVAMFLTFRKSWAHLFNDDPLVVQLVASILPLVSLFQVFDGLSAITSGILRAVGKQFTGALLNLSAYYVVGIPFGMWLAFDRGMNLHGLWIGLTISLVYAAAVGVWLCLLTDWDKGGGQGPGASRRGKRDDVDAFN